MRFLPYAQFSLLRNSSDVARRGGPIDLEVTGGEQYFEHDAEARPPARIYWFPLRATTRFSLRLLRKV